MNKKKATELILGVISTAENTVQLNQSEYFRSNADVLENNFKRVRLSFSGSSLGYHANVYYAGFDTPAPGDSFSPEWGLMDLYGRGTGGWQEVTDDKVKAHVMNQVDSSYPDRFQEISSQASTSLRETHDSLTTLLTILSDDPPNQMFVEIGEQLSNVPGFITKQDLIAQSKPTGVAMTRDMKAMSQGHQTPPHIDLEAWHLSLSAPFLGLSKIMEIGQRLHRFMELQELVEFETDSVGEKVFIGHGRSTVWRELQAFLSDRLNLEWDEFNREPSAGLATQERLRSMVDQARFAFLVMTAEDEHADELMHARENLVHEIGLFQGKLGFRRAIILLEEGCAEFSNITGLVQIRFPSGNIGACFEEIRRVLEREHIIGT